MCKLCTLKTKITLLKEIKENLNRDKPCSLIRRFNIITMTTLPQIYKFNEVPIKILETFENRIERLILKFIKKHKGPKVTKAMFF